MIPVLLGVLIIVFSLSYLMPGDPVVNQLGTSNYTQEQYDAVQKELGLDKPFVVQMVDYIWGVISRFDLGTSYTTKRGVADALGQRIWVTVELGLLSTIVTVALAIPFGVISAVKQRSAIDYTVTVLSVVLAAMPGFWLALMCIIIFCLKLGWLPARGLDSWRGYILPVLCNALTALAGTTRMTRSSMLEVIRQDYIRTARAKGLKERTVIFRHALKNAMIPVITVIGAQISMIVGGSVIIESIFSIPGMGTLLVTGINNRDYPTIMGVTLVISTFVCVMNLVVDLCYSIADPRIRAQFSGGGRKRRHMKLAAAEGGKTE